MRFLDRQPTPSTDVEVFLQSEKLRISAELDGISTTDNRNLIDTFLVMSSASVSRLVEKPTDEALHEADATVRALHAAFVYNSLQETLVELPDFLNRPHSEHLEDRSYIEKAAGIGSVLLHGLDVTDWLGRHPDGILSDDNVVAATVSGMLTRSLGDKDEVMKFGRIFKSLG